MKKSELKKLSLHVDWPGFEPEFNQNLGLEGRRSSPLSHEMLIENSTQFQV